ncbi:prolipoprotein diacylglyceryl transferase [Fulvivirga sediminis]|uniref:Phosphatidylglycerol--prolipoprotein diacylglyceryl transferase n=1 Tax=Fulvivirga sediminis TaxID=2803949 RepID=A0A937FBC4_9BACT|nr:prolipoprotein diacylglyceryl transferase [Fulvivirga sediminis]MBL3658049.1 prolipoprotein diacylglyceryl transferase [Fulvivirga sediminis]
MNNIFSLDYIHWNPSKEIIDLGFYALRWYSLCFALGFVLSFYLLKKQFKTAGLDETYLEKLTMYLVLATVIGARLAHCIFYDFDYYSQHIAEIFLPVKFDPFRFVGFQGLASHGGILGVFIATILFCRKYKVKPLWLLDRLSVVGALAGCCIRMGNLMNSEIIGKPTDVAWAFIFEQVDNVPRHPGQLYEAIAYFSIFVILSIVLKKSNRHNGFIFGLFFTLLFIARFLIEFVKADQSAFEAGMMFNMGQLLSIPFIIFGLVMMYLKKDARDPDENAAKLETK